MIVTCLTNKDKRLAVPVQPQRLRAAVHPDQLAYLSQVVASPTRLVVARCVPSNQQLEALRNPCT